MEPGATQDATRRDSTPWQSFCADRARYPRSAWLTEPSLWAVAVYRLGQATLVARGPARGFLFTIYAVLAPIVRLVTNIELPRSVPVGPGLRLFHRGPIVLNAARIGRNCNINTCVLVGKRSKDPTDIPVIGDDVTLGAFSQVLGRVAVGDGAFVGAMTLVIKDVPPGMSAAGVPARTFPRKARS